MNYIPTVLRRWLRLAFVVTVLSIVIYILTQQHYRMALNDPQIQMVKDAQSMLLAGKQPAEIVGRAQVFDASTRMDPFLAVYDESGNTLEANATVDGLLPRPPVGIFEYAKSHGENKVTWQTKNGTRIALVVRPVAIESGWFVAAGRNMSEAEAKISLIGNRILVAWLTILIVTFFVDLLGKMWERKEMM
jgi:hypothetical protein